MSELDQKIENCPFQMYHKIQTNWWFSICGTTHQYKNPYLQKSIAKGNSMDSIESLIGAMFKRLGALKKHDLWILHLLHISHTENHIEYILPKGFS